MKTRRCQRNLGVRFVHALPCRDANTEAVELYTSEVGAIPPGRGFPAGAWGAYHGGFAGLPALPCGQHAFAPVRLRTAQACLPGATLRQTPPDLVRHARGGRRHRSQGGGAAVVPGAACLGREPRRLAAGARRAAAARTRGAAGAAAAADQAADEPADGEQRPVGAQLRGGGPGVCPCRRPCASLHSATMQTACPHACRHECARLHACLCAWTHTKTRTHSRTHACHNRMPNVGPPSACSSTT